MTDVLGIIRMQNAGARVGFGVAAELVRGPHDAAAAVSAVRGYRQYAAGHTIGWGGRWALRRGGLLEEIVGSVESILADIIGLALQVGKRAVRTIPPDGRSVDIVEAAAGRYLEALDKPQVWCSQHRRL